MDHFGNQLGRVVVVGAVVAAAGVVSGCSSGAKVEKKPQEPVISTGLNALDDPRLQATADVRTEGGDETETKLRLMEQAMLHGDVSVDRAAAVPASGAKGRTPLVKQVEGETTGDEVVEAEVEEVVEGEGELAGPVPAAAKDEGPGTEELVEQLAAKLRAAAATSSMPAAELMQLAVLELLKPGATGSVDSAALSDEEKAFLDGWRSLFAGARDSMKKESDVTALAAQVSELAERMLSARAFEVSTTRLCQRVDGYGMYEEIGPRGPSGAYTMVAGKRQKAIVYLELTGFAYTEKVRSGSPGYLVELTQKLELYQLARDGEMVVWEREAQDVVDFSRSRRRDFFVTQVIELPRTLGAGGYRLKVTMKDKASGAVAESVVPIEMVAGK